MNITELQESKSQFCDTLYNKVLLACSILGEEKIAKSELLLSILNVSKDGLDNDLYKIANALPEYLIQPELDLTDEISDFICKEYMLFKAQEDQKDPAYTILLTNFIQEVTGTLICHYNEPRPRSHHERRV